MLPGTPTTGGGGVRQETHTGEADLSGFLLHVSHDLKTALRAILVHSDLLLKSHQAMQVPGLEERLGFIADGARKIDLLTAGIASYSVALQIRRELFQPAPMEVLLRAVLAKLDGEIRANHAGVSHDKLPRVHGEPDRLMEVFENLLHNALRHRGAADPAIHIAVEKQPEAWLFTVRDNGPGVPAEYLESIFQPFVRLQGSQRPGPGLGLAICRIILERHGGRIWAESTEGSGAAFRFTLPAE